MCSWCWAFRPAWQEFLAQCPADITVQYVLGGLAEDSMAAMPLSLQSSLQNTWRKIQQTVPGTVFNFDFWTRCQPRRSTWIACRAVIAATDQGEPYQAAMILATQNAYYLSAKNPSDEHVLIGLAEDLGLNIPAFTLALNSEQTRQRLSDQMALARQLGAQGFPSLILSLNGRQQLLRLDYNHPGVMLESLGMAQ